ncbi:BAR domain-containing protein [Coemansia interrupta]|uniref:BAR domain-containing protein n=1 Tax=Coemansia interrupta TaxID=1126814 RepID=A0A9W8LFY9_9FUNG|nr:BAR domain-containing protein [Coemansia interrupta]
MDSFTKFTQSVSSNWTPFADKVGRSLTQYKQLASEKLTSTATITPLPADYLALERRFLAIHQTHQTLSRLTQKTYLPPYTPYDMQRLGQQITTLTTKISQPSTSAIQAEEASKKEAQEATTYEHLLGRAALDVSEDVGLEEPLGAGLFKFASIEEKVGDARVVLGRAVDRGFVQPLEDMGKGGVALAMAARKQVAAARLELDAAKSTMVSATKHVDEARQQVEQAEDRFVTAIEEATRLMEALVASPETLRHLAELVSAQLAFHRECAALLGDLAPELDEILTTQEALYRAK